MSQFQIGRIEGPWTNFLPPIQGGRFQTADEAKLTNTLGSESSSTSSRRSSLSISPIFEPVHGKEGLRARQRSFMDSETSSISSLSSLENSREEVGETLSHTQRLTQIKLKLDLAKYPSTDAATQSNIVAHYRRLNETMHKERLYDCNYRAYAIEICRYLFLFSMCLWLLRRGWYGTSGLLLGCFWHQLVFTAHDAGHMGITHSFTIDTIIGIILADFLGGLSLGWWKRSHNIHHIVTNSPEHDPDIEQMPFLAISHRFFESLKSTYHDRVMRYDSFAKFAVRFQQYLYYPLLTFGRFNLYRLSWEYLILGQGPRKGPAWWHRWLEIAGQVFFWTWFGYGVVYKGIPTAGGRILFVMISHMATAILHVQITLSHFAMSTTDLGIHESFPQKMLRTTMDVDCPEWLDFFHGGLQFQVIHHLYPRIPRHNLRRAQRLVQAFCEEVKIPYALYGFVDGNKEVLGQLGEVGRQAAILAQCQTTIATTRHFAL